MPIGLIEQLVHTTVRIDCTLANGSQSCGTGFFFRFLESGDQYAPAIVTNKHVIAGAMLGRIHFTFVGEDGEPKLGSHEQFEINNFEQAWIKHPDPHIDLAIFPLAALMSDLKRQNKTPYVLGLEKHIIPSQDEREKFSVMEDVVMIGYPSGLWDEVNNLPIIRRGVTATHIKTKWNGKDEFLTDIASFGGSSGSPVFLVNIGSYANPTGGVVVGDRLKFIGIHYAGAVHQADGTIKIRTVPTNTDQIASTLIPNNIGVAISSLRILDFENILAERLKRRTSYGVSGAVVTFKPS